MFEGEVVTSATDGVCQSQPPEIDELGDDYQLPLIRVQLRPDQRCRTHTECSTT